jgi:uroporphyrinogen decarboxylase
MLLYEDPPAWKARMDACTYFGVDALFATFVPMAPVQIPVVYRDQNKMITRYFSEKDRRRYWSPYAQVYTPQEPSALVKAKTIGLPPEHDEFEIVTPSYGKIGRDYFEDARAYVGEGGVVAPIVGLPGVSCWEEETYRYFDDREAVLEEKRLQGEQIMDMVQTILAWKPDALMIGHSGMMIFNPPNVFRELGLQWLQKITKLAKEHGVPTHLHCCGPERALVEIAANETDLSCIEPLEIPPMGDCNLKEIKEKFGHKIALKGNLHTTAIMLRGTPQEVEDACKKAIDDAAVGGGFILSTGDQTPRDTPEENIRIMQRVAETYGRY